MSDKQNLEAAQLPSGKACGWVDLKVLEELASLRRVVDEAIISVHRINAINTAGGKIRPWTDEQRAFVERERFDAIHSVVRMLPHSQAVDAFTSAAVPPPKNGSGVA